MIRDIYPQYISMSQRHSDSYGFILQEEKVIKRESFSLTEDQYNWLRDFLNHSLAVSRATGKFQSLEGDYELVLEHTTNVFNNSSSAIELTLTEVQTPLYILENLVDDMEWSGESSYAHPNISLEEYKNYKDLLAKMESKFNDAQSVYEILC